MQRSGLSVIYSLGASVVFLLTFLFLLPVLPTLKSATCRVQDTTEPIPLAELSKFQNSNVEVLCHRLPDASATYIWSQLKLSVKKLRPSGLKRHIQNSPSRTQIQSIANRITTSPQKPLDILILLSHAQADIKWPQKLQRLVNDDADIGGMRVKVDASVIDDEKRILERVERADIVVDCRGSDEMQFLKTRFSDLAVLPDAINYLHVLKQSRIRSLLTRTITNPPLLILVADSPTNYNALSSSVYARTVQRLAHWYQLGYILKGQDEGDSFEQIIAFAILVWLVDYCSSPPLQDTKALLPGVQKLVEQSMRPPLELGTSWKDISEEWNNLDGYSVL